MAGASTLKAYFQSRRRLEQKLEAAQAEAALQEAVSARQTDEIEGLLGQCEELEERLVKMQRSERDLLEKIRQLAKRGDTLETALRATAPQCRTAGDQKAFYAQVAPALDENGFQLYWTAKEITGIDVRNEFPYEDSLGRFAEADGNVLMQYLVPLYFGAVDWEVVGATYERAILGTVDTTTEAYRAFEKHLYGLTLQKLGFQIGAPQNERHTPHRKGDDRDR